MQGDKSKSTENSLSFVRKAIIRMVLADLRRTETGNQALQHLGILWIIYEYATTEEPITTVRLGELTGVNSASLIRFTERLMTLDLITRTRVRASNGKGKAWAYSPALAQDVLEQGIFKINAALRALERPISSGDGLSKDSSVGVSPKRSTGTDANNEKPEQSPDTQRRTRTKPRS